MNFDIPQDLADYLKELDDFIEHEIKPLQAENDNERFLTIVAKTPEPTGIAVDCQMKNGRRCSPKRTTIFRSGVSNMRGREAAFAG